MENSVSDDEVASKLLSQEESYIEGIIGDGAYDKKKVYDSCIRKGISTILIPPRKDVKIWQHGNSSVDLHPRDENLRQMRNTSRKRWKEGVKYHARSMVENAIFRLKSIFGDKLYARILARQRTPVCVLRTGREVNIKVAILNRIMKLRMSESYAIA